MESLLISNMMHNASLGNGVPTTISQMSGLENFLNAASMNFPLPSGVAYVGYPSPQPGLALSYAPSLCSGFYPQMQPLPSMPIYSDACYMAVPGMNGNWSCHMPPGHPIHPPQTIDVLAPAATHSDSSSGYRASNKSSDSPDGILQQNLTTSSFNTLSSLWAQQLSQQQQHSQQLSSNFHPPSSLFTCNPHDILTAHATHHLNRNFQQSQVSMASNQKLRMSTGSIAAKREPHQMENQVQQAMSQAYFDKSKVLVSPGFNDREAQYQQHRKVVYSNNILYKTILCNDYQAAQERSCPRGENCQFAHGFQDLHAPARHQLYHTKMCSDLQNFGKCTRGMRCYHAHSPAELKLRSKQSNVTCTNNMPVT